MLSSLHPNIVFVLLIIFWHNQYPCRATARRFCLSLSVRVCVICRWRRCCCCFCYEYHRQYKDICNACPDTHFSCVSLNLARLWASLKKLHWYNNSSKNSNNKRQHVSCYEYSVFSNNSKHNKYIHTDREKDSYSFFTASPIQPVCVWVCAGAMKTDVCVLYGLQRVELYMFVYIAQDLVEHVNRILLNSIFIIIID